MPAVKSQEKAGNRVLQVENICLTYAGAGRKPQCALDNVSFSFAAGECAALLGPNGAGKSTLLEIIAGLMPPDSGRIQLFTNNGDSPGIDIGLVFQFPERQLFGDTVFEDVAFGPNNFKWSESDVQQAVRSALESVGLSHDDFGERSPFKLSAGERRRVAIAGVLALRPRILVLDEPTAGVDARGVQDIRRTLSRLREQGITILLVSHDMDFVAAETARIVALDKGQLVFDGAKEDFFGNIALVERLRLEQPAVRQYIASFSDELRPQLENIWDREALQNQLRALDALPPLPVPPGKPENG